MFDERRGGAKRAIVVGGGPAGTSAAFRLQQAGVDVTLIERDARVGGRTRSERIDGYIVDVAAGLVPGSYAALYSLMSDAGLSDLLEPMTSPMAISRDGKLHYLDLAKPVRSFLATPLIGMGSKLRLAKIAFRASRMWSSLDFVSMAPTAPFDDQTIEQYARATFDGDVFDYLLNPTEKLMYTIRGEEASVVDLFWCAKNLFHPKAFCVKGGMDCVVTGVAKQLKVRTGTEVLRVDETGGQVRVTMRDAAGRESTESVDACVIAVPGRDVPKIDIGLSEPGRRFLSQLRYSMLTDIHLRLKSRPAEKAVLILCPNSVDPDLAGLLLDHNKGADRAPPGKGAISAYFMDHWATAMFDKSDQEVFDQGIGKIDRALPGVAKLVEGYHVQRWDFAATASYPGYYKKLAAFVEGLNVDRRVQLAGDYFAMASVNTAVTSGQVAAKRLIEKYVVGAG